MHLSSANIPLAQVNIPVTQVDYIFISHSHRSVTQLEKFHQPPSHLYPLCTGQYPSYRSWTIFSSATLIPISPLHGSVSQLHKLTIFSSATLISISPLHGSVSQLQKLDYIFISHPHTCIPFAQVSIPVTEVGLYFHQPPSYLYPPWLSRYPSDRGLLKYCTHFHLPSSYQECIRGRRRSAQLLHDFCLGIWDFSLLRGFAHIWHSLRNLRV